MTRACVDCGDSPAYGSLARCPACLRLALQGDRRPLAPPPEMLTRCELGWFVAALLVLLLAVAAYGLAEQIRRHDDLVLGPRAPSAATMPPLGEEPSEP